MQEPIDIFNALMNRPSCSNSIAIMYDLKSDDENNTKNYQEVYRLLDKCKQDNSEINHIVDSFYVFESKYTISQIKYEIQNLPLYNKEDKYIIVDITIKKLCIIGNFSKENIKILNTMFGSM